MNKLLTIPLLGMLALQGQNVQAAERVPVLIAFHQPPGPSEQALVHAFGGIIKYTYHLVPAIAATLPQEAIHALENQAAVARVELDGTVRAIDAELDNTWGVKHIGAGNVHGGGNKGSNVKVCVIDSGIDYTHSEMAYYAGGYDFINKDAEPLDDNGHGTHVAGTVAAADNGLGVVGVAPEASIYALKILDASGNGNWSDAVAALQWCVDNQGHITNNSYSDGNDPGITVQQAFDNAAAAGILHVAAAGNAGNLLGTGDNVGYPAKFESVIAVAATDSNDQRASFSSTGTAVELAAPGVNIKSTVPGGGYGTANGTSMASPHVAGTAALVIASGISDANGDGKINDEIRTCLQQTANDLGSAGLDSHYGYGLVDAIESTNGSCGAGSTINNPPVASAGPDQTVTDRDGNGEEQVTLDGSGSDDPDGSITSYQWLENNIQIAATPQPTVNLGVGDHTIVLRVTDDAGATAEDTVLIQVTAKKGGGNGGGGSGGDGGGGGGNGGGKKPK